MKIKLEISKVVENKEKKQLRFSLRISALNVTLLTITGMRIKNGKLFFPSYAAGGGRHKPLVLPGVEVLDKVKSMVENIVAWQYSDYASNVETAHCLASENDEKLLMGDKPVSMEFEL